MDPRALDVQVEAIESHNLTAPPSAIHLGQTRHFNHGEQPFPRDDELAKETRFIELPSGVVNGKWFWTIATIW